MSDMFLEVLTFNGGVYAYLVPYIHTNCSLLGYVSRVLKGVFNW